MALKNKSMYAILGILDLSPCSGYEIKQFSDRVLSGFWNENFGHIYPTLKKLLDNGLIEKNERYSITEKGKRELERWLVEETVQQPVRSEFMLKLFFSSSQPKSQVVRMLEIYKELNENKRNNYFNLYKEVEKGIKDVSNSRAFYYKMVLRKGILSSEAAVCWCDEMLTQLQVET